MHPRLVPDWAQLIAALPSPKVVFIAGTDTDVGKTFITTEIARAGLEMGLAVHVLKPVQTGVQPDEPGDVETVLGRLGVQDRLTGQTLYRFEPPAAPWPADLQGILNDEALIRQIQNQIVPNRLTLIEGAGGLRVPITRTLDMLGLMQALEVPTVLVTRPHLGTINHTRLSCDALVAAKIPCLGVIVNSGPSAAHENADSFAQKTLPAVLAAYLPVPVLGYIERENLCG
jgi:dethiobiotin synthase